MPRTPALGSLRLVTPVAALPGVTEKRAQALQSLGLKSLAHLIHHAPFRYERVGAEASIAQLVPGTIVSARGEVTATRPVLRGRRPRIEVVLSDGTGRLDIVFFNQPYLAQRLLPGMRLHVQGKAARFGPSGHGIRLTNPTWRALGPDDEADPAGPSAERLRPVYPASDEAPSAFIDGLIQRVLEGALPLIKDHLPEDYTRERAMPALRETYRRLHRPADEDEAASARRRLVYDELLLLQLGVQMKRAYVRRALRAPALRWSRAIDEHIRARLPFTLTRGQEQAVKDIAADLQKPEPANRLIQGDVGSGKTAVALYAMLMAAASSRQAALMAPTQLLAEQHFASISALLAGSSVRLKLVTASSARSREPFDIAIGTHALLGEGVGFESLAVAVIDEQHRFGVHQRARLRWRGDEQAPHVLVMTATPIPRTLALTIFGDLDVSVIRGGPPGRSPIASRLVPEGHADEVYAYIRKKLERGEQAYIVVPAVDGGEGKNTAEARSGLRTVRETLAALERGPLAGKRLAAMHGRLKPETRDAVMARFRAGQIDALVCTTVIEVGVDVPNATMMVIHQAERFGLAQLHQMRGRVGRGAKQSLCVFLHSESAGAEAIERLKIAASTSDGFKLAEADLTLRGPGEVIGARQAGAAPFRLAEFPRDTDLLMLARRDASAWIARSPTLSGPGEELLRQRLMKAHAASLGLADIA